MSEPLAVNSRGESRMTWIAEDPASKAVLELARKVAETSTTLLITGESGTGKDHLARLIHELGPRRDAPFLKIDCASLPQELVESELFGNDLFFRLSVLTISVAPLRDRPADILPLTDALLERVARVHGRAGPAFA